MHGYTCPIATSLSQSGVVREGVFGREMKSGFRPEAEGQEYNLYSFPEVFHEGYEKKLRETSSKNRADSSSDN
jgi:hypothetical protein